MEEIAKHSLMLSQVCVLTWVCHWLNMGACVRAWVGGFGLVRGRARQCHQVLTGHERQQPHPGRSTHAATTHSHAPQHASRAAPPTPHTPPFLQDPFGNYVVQYVLELGHPETSAAVMTNLKGHYSELATQKFRCAGSRPTTTRGPSPGR